MTYSNWAVSLSLVLAACSDPGLLDGVGGAPSSPAEGQAGTAVSAAGTGGNGAEGGNGGSVVESGGGGDLGPVAGGGSMGGGGTGGSTVVTPTAGRPSTPEPSGGTGGSEPSGGSSVGGGGAGGTTSSMGGMGGTGGSGGPKLIPATVYIDCIRYQDPNPRFRISYSSFKFYKQDEDGNEILLWPDGTPTGPEGMPLAGQVITETAKCYTYVNLPDMRYAYSFMPFGSDGLQYGRLQRDIQFDKGTVVTTLFNFLP